MGEGEFMLDYFATMSDRQRFWSVLLLAFVLRAIWGMIIPVVPVSDPQAYDTLAIHISQHGIYGFTPTLPSAFWPVGTSAMYAFLYIIFGHSYAAVVVVNILLGVLVVALTIVVVEKLFGRAVGLVAGLLVAIWPTLIQFTTVVASELIFTALVLLVVAFTLARESAGPRRALLLDVSCGVAMAAATYVRPIGLLFPVLFGFILLVRSVGWRNVAGFVAVTAVTMAMLIAPWALRNKEQMGTYALISTNGGVNLWMGNNPETTGEYQEVPARVSQLSEAERDRVLKEEATAYIKADPVGFVARTVVKALRLYERETIGAYWNYGGLMQVFGEGAILPSKLITQAFWMAAFGLSLIGAAMAVAKYGFRMSADYYTVLIIIGYMTAVYAVIVIQDRYHLPTIPYLAAFAAMPLVQLAARLGLGRPALTAAHGK
jgi:4-amino-4-deoxy-L-arabinose transferase-like glycosyltransferase